MTAPCNDGATPSQSREATGSSAAGRLTRRGALTAGLTFSAAPAIVRAGSLGSKGRAVVVGGGVFGAWTARRLQQAGHHVTLLDAWEPGHSRSSSGGESRMCRAAYGAKDIYTRWAWESMAEYVALSTKAELPLFYATGVLFMFPSLIPYAADTVRTHEALKLPIQVLEQRELAKRFPMIDFDGVGVALYEPKFGPVMARRSVEVLVHRMRAEGVEYRQMRVAPFTREQAELKSVAGLGGDTVEGDLFAFACGAWLPQVFPNLLKDRIFASRQEIFFFATPEGDRTFEAGSLPSWSELGSAGNNFYGFPSVEGRGFKIGSGLRGGPFEMDHSDRLPTPERIDEVRKYLAGRFPRMASAAINSAEVCAYENTVGGDFLIDRHPAWKNAILIGGGSGHGFKHGPALGRYAAELLTGRLARAEPRFALSSKKLVDDANRQLMPGRP